MDWLRRVFAAHEREQSIGREEQMRKRYVRNLVVAIVSGFSVLALTGYLTMTSAEAFTAAVAKVSHHKTRHGAVIYGRVAKPGGEAATHVKVVLLHRLRYRGHFRWVPVRHKHVRTDKQGLYRMRTHAGNLEIRFALGRHRATLHRRIRVGDHIQISARLAKGLTFSLLPIFFY